MTLNLSSCRRMGRGQSPRQNHPRHRRNKFKSQSALSIYCTIIWSDARRLPHHICRTAGYELSRSYTETRYRDLRRLAHRHAERQITSDMAIRISDIGPSAIDQYVRTWIEHPDRKTDFEWTEITQYFRKRPDRFEAAIWSDDVLCGLAIGRPSDGRDVMNLVFLEGCPEEAHPLKGMVHRAALEAAHAYGTAINSKILRLIDPIPPVIPLYQRIGFRLVTPTGESAYCEKEI